MIGAVRKGCGGTCWLPGFFQPFLLLGFTALASANPPGPAEYLARYDTDSDRRVSLAEYQAYLARGFAQMDRNRDGRIDALEWPRPGRRALTLAQHHRHLAAAFHRQDIDGDGFLDLTELTAPPR